MLTEDPQCNYQVLPLRAGFVTRARQTGRDDLDQQVERSIATGGEPCRDVLRRALPGEELILASYCPFEIDGPYKEYGPVFILANGSAAGPRLQRLPLEGSGAYFAAPFVLRAYSRQERIVDAVLTGVERAEHALQRFLARDDIAFVMARFGAYGCYACRIERSGTARPASVPSAAVDDLDDQGVLE